jgi:hypothetical protein
MRASKAVNVIVFVVAAAAVGVTTVTVAVGRMLWITATFDDVVIVPMQ